MFISEISPNYFGPFRTEAVLKLSSEVTVITGANDVGKSTLLLALQILCTPKESASEELINRARLLSSGKPWDKDGEVGAFVRMLATNSGIKSIVKANLPSGTIVEALFHFAPNIPGNSEIRHHSNREIRFPDGERRGDIDISRMPRSLLLNSSQNLDSIIELKSSSKLERCFLQAAFGTNFRYEQFDSWNDLNVETAIQHAEERFAEIARRTLPQSLQYRFRFRRLPDQKTKLAIQVVDQHRGMVPFASRGEGARKLIGLLVTSLSFVQDTPCLLLLDEPENSLHADAQRVLRRFLEGLAERDGVQVVYSTHSPMMINPLRADSVRLVSLTTDNTDTAAATIENSPCDGNFLKVRTSLGLLPSDSLLYSDVGIIVEGLTECVGLPELLLRLEKHSEQFRGVSEWLPEIHFINGMGDNFERLCKLAESQGVRPLIFVDGDKIKQIRQLNLAESHPGVPVLHLPDGVEIEQILPLEIYFAAAAEIQQLDPSKVTVEAFDEWKRTSPIPKLALRAFSKQVNLWFEEQFDVSLDKPRTMKRAIELVDSSAVRHQDILEGLHLAVSRRLKETTGGSR